MRLRFALLFVLAGCGGEAPLAAPDDDLALAKDAADETLASDPSQGLEGVPVLDAGIDVGSIPEPPPSSDAAAKPTPPPLPPGADPPAFPAYSRGKCPTLKYGVDEASSLNTGFATGTDTRAFRLVVPSTYDGKSEWPLLFAWHWLGASGASFLKDGELATAAAQLGFLVVLPEKLESGGKGAYKFDWPFVETAGAARELLFFDDMLACVSSQLRVAKRRVHAVGVSAGGLWLSYLASTPHVQWLGSIETLSGGLGAMAGWKMSFTPQPNKYAALVLWGGPSDTLGVNFDEASRRLRDALLADKHAVVTCVHDKGHVMPPIASPTDGSTRFAALWRFLLDHPYGISGSPYAALPASFPSWCKKP